MQQGPDTALVRPTTEASVHQGPQTETKTPLDIIKLRASEVRKQLNSPESSPEAKLAWDNTITDKRDYIDRLQTEQKLKQGIKTETLTDTAGRPITMDWERRRQLLEIGEGTKMIMRAQLASNPEYSSASRNLDKLYGDILEELSKEALAEGIQEPDPIQLHERALSILRYS